MKESWKSDQSWLGFNEWRIPSITRPIVTHGPKVAMPKFQRGPSEHVPNLVPTGLIKLALMLPYRARLAFSGSSMTHLIAPLFGSRKRVRNNLAMIMPQMTPDTVERLVKQVPDNVGRSLIEICSGAEFVAHVRGIPLVDAEAQALKKAKVADRPVILVAGHFDNYDTARAFLVANGHRADELYNPMLNGYFKDHYVNAIIALGTPVLERGRSGLGQMLRFLKSGGMVGMVMDQHVREGVPINFMGRPADTALSATQMAVK